MTADELTEILRRELTPIRDELAVVRRSVDAMAPQVAGIPLLHRAVDGLRQESRQIKVAVNDLAAIQVTSGEIEALHADVNKTMSREDELEARLSVVERMVRELSERR